MARAFLKAQAALFGSYRNALHIEPVREKVSSIDVLMVLSEAQKWL